MERGKKAARDLLLEIRERAGNYGGRDRAAMLAALGALISASIPESEPLRAGFFLILADYLASSLSGYPPDPDSL